MRKSSFRPLFIVYALALLISITTGTIIKVYSTDPTTGFVNTGSFPGDNILLIVYRLSLLLPVIFWFLLTAKRRSKQDYPLSYSQPSAGILAAITGVAIILYSFTELKNQIVNEKLLAEQPNVLLVNSLGVRILILGISICGLLAGLSLISTMFKPKYLNSKNRGSLLGFFPALWQIVVLFARFNNFIAVTTINDILMILLFMCFAAMFLIGQSRVMFGLGVRSGKTYAIPAGLSVSLIGFSLAVPAIITYFINGSLTYVIKLGVAELSYIIALSLYAIVFVRGFIKSIKIV